MHDSRNDILGKVIHTSSGKTWVYDGLSGKIMAVHMDVDNSRIDSNQSDQELLQQLTKSGYLNKGRFQDVRWHCDYQEYVERIENSLSQLVLQMTRQCNLDCKYCVYSGKFKHMLPHANEYMSDEVIRQSIDFYFAHSINTAKRRISFYGGESLLCFSQIRETVAYAEMKDPEKEMLFMISTNGMLLKEETVQWMSFHPEVSAAVTLNGPYHDLYRIKPNGEGSLAVIMENLRQIRKTYTNVWEKQISFIANIASESELMPLLQFYRTEVGRPPDTITMIRTDAADASVSEMFSKEEPGETFDNDGLCQTYMEVEDRYLDAWFQRGLSLVHNRDIYEKDTTAYVSSCLPLASKLFVRTDGNFNICERVSDRLSLGNPVDGYNERMLRRLYDQMQQYVQRHCTTCWAQRMCMLCYQELIGENGKFNGEAGESWCVRMLKEIEKNLRMYCEIAETNRERLKNL